MSDKNVGHKAILFVYEMNPESVEFFFIPANSGLNKNLIGALHKLDGVLVNTDRGPKDDLTWKAWEYVNAAMTDEEWNLNHENPYNANRFYAQLLPFKLSSTTRYTFETKSFSLIRSGTIL